MFNWQRFQSVYYQFVWVRPLLAKSQWNCKIQFSTSTDLYQTRTTLSRMPVPCIWVNVFSMLQNKTSNKKPQNKTTTKRCSPQKMRKNCLNVNVYSHTDTPTYTLIHTRPLTHPRNISQAPNIYTQNYKEGLIDIKAYKCPYWNEKVRIYFLNCFPYCHHWNNWQSSPIYQQLLF